MIQFFLVERAKLLPEQTHQDIRYMRLYPLNVGGERISLVHLVMALKNLEKEPFDLRLLLWPDVEEKVLNYYLLNLTLQLEKHGCRVRVILPKRD